MGDKDPSLTIKDMSGGLVTNIGAQSIGPNQTPDSLNVFAYLGEMLFRGGFNQFSTLPGKCDGAIPYYDPGNTFHMLAWVNGDIYDFASGAPVLVAAAVYVSGQQIAKCQLNGIIYWATLTVPLRQYDGTTEMAVPNSGGVGVIPPPACNFLIPYAGSLVAVYPVPGGVPAPSAFMWCVPNDPTTWFGTSIQTVGSNDGSVCTFALLMGIVPGAVSNPGIPSTRQLLVGKTTKNIFLYQGALGTLTENAVPCPVGAIDPNSAVYIPSDQGLGTVMFVGSDGNMWRTNGSTAEIASNNIQNLVYTLVKNALLADAFQKFNAIYNDRYQYYLVDFGNNTQLAFKWDTGAWWLFQGWPSGCYVPATARNGLPTIYVCAGQNDTSGVYEIGLTQTNDNGSDINAYYTTPWLHGGKPEKMKMFNDLVLSTYNVGVQYTVTAFTMPRADGTVEQSQPNVLNDPAFGAQAVVASGAIWDVSLWDQSQWGGGFPSLSQPYAMTEIRGVLNTLTTAATKWAPAGVPTKLRSGAIQLKVQWSAGIPDFRIIALNVGFKFRTGNFVGALPFSTQGQQTTQQDNKFTNVGGQS